MKHKALLVLLVLITLVGLGLTATGTEFNNRKETMQKFDMVKLVQSSPTYLKVPINLTNNSTKEVWTSPGNIPVSVSAGVTNNGNIGMNVYTISINPRSRVRYPPHFAGRALPGGDGVIIYGKFVAIEVRCDNSTETQYCNGTLEMASSFPQES